MIKCAAVYANGVQAGAAAQRSTTLSHLLTYSLLSLADVPLLAAAAGWITAGRILRPVHRLTAAARAQVAARAIGIVEGTVKRVLVEGDHLCGVEMDDGRTVRRDALFVPPRFTFAVL